MQGLMGRSGGIAVVLIAASSAACVSAGGYTGIGALTVSGQPAVLTQVSAKLVSCVGYRSEETGPQSAGPLGGPDAASATCDVLSLGAGCRIEGTLGFVFVPTPGATCSLDFAEG